MKNLAGPARQESVWGVVPEKHGPDSRVRGFGATRLEYEAARGIWLTGLLTGPPRRLVPLSFVGTSVRFVGGLRAGSMLYP